MNKIQKLKNQAEESAKKLHYALVDLSEAYKADNKLNESDFQEFVIVNVIPKLREFEEIYSNTALDTLDLCWRLSDTERAFHLPSIKAAIMEMEFKAVTWVESHIYNLKEITKLCKKHGIKDSHLDDLQESIETMDEALKETLWDRSQIYKSEAKGIGRKRKLETELNSIAECEYDPVTEFLESLKELRVKDPDRANAYLDRLLDKLQK